MSAIFHFIEATLESLSRIPGLGFLRHTALEMRGKRVELEESIGDYEEEVESAKGAIGDLKNSIKRKK